MTDTINGNGRREVSLRDFFSVIFRRIWVILGVFVAALVVVVFLNASSPVRYVSESRVLVSRGQPESAFNSRLRVLTWEEELNSEIETIGSAQIVQAAQESLDEEGEVESDGSPIRLDPGSVRATTSGKSAVIYITYRSESPRTARIGARVITQAYAEFRLRIRAVPEVEEFFRSEIETLREELDEWGMRRAQFMNEESVVRIADERINILAVRQQTEVDLSRLRAEIAEEKAKVEILNNRILREGDELNVYAFSEGENKDDQVLARLRNELIRERTEFYKATAQYTDDYPLVQSLRNRVEYLENDLRAEVHNYIRHLEGRIETLKAREKALLQTIQFGDAELASFPDKEARLASFGRVIEQLEANYKALIDKQIQARIQRSGTSDWNVLVLQPAAPAQPIRVNDYVRMAIIPMLSLLLGVALAFLVDGFDHSLKDATEVEHHLQLPVLGSVGRLR